MSCVVKMGRAEVELTKGKSGKRRDNKKQDNFANEYTVLFYVSLCPS